MRAHVRTSQRIRRLNVERSPLRRPDLVPARVHHLYHQHTQTCARALEARVLRIAGYRATCMLVLYTAMYVYVIYGVTCTTGMIMMAPSTRIEHVDPGGTGTGPSSSSR